jgi:sugar phosphate isomerase/epimerase
MNAQVFRTTNGDVAGDGMTLQSRFERFLGGPAAGGLPIPRLDAALGCKLLARTEELRWLLNRYSLELNFLHGSWGIEAFFSFARDGGFDGVQLHITRSGPRVGLTAESDQYLAELAAQPGTRRLDITLDVSTIDRGDLNDASRVARAMGVRTIRCYSSAGGTIKGIIGGAIEQLKYAAELGSRLGICFLLEQHERLKGPEILEILDGVGAGPSIGALFDFGNPIPANRDPLADLYELRGVIRGAHSKDVIVVPEGRGQGCIGVSFGQGDLPLPKIYFDLLMLGEDEPQVEFIAVQSVVGYWAPPGRHRGESSSHMFHLKSSSKTPITETGREQRLARERQDAHQDFEAAKLLVNQLRSYATEAVCVPDTPAKLGPEASLIRAIEEIGRQLYGEPDRKRIWQAIETSDGSDLDGIALDPKEARALLTVAGEKRQELRIGCV